VVLIDVFLWVCLFYFLGSFGAFALLFLLRFGSAGWHIVK